VHTAPAFLLHRTKIGKGVMKKIRNRFRMEEGTFFGVVIFHFSMEKATMNAPRLWKLRSDCLTGIG
jgi:hypothetical protein